MFNMKLTYIWAKFFKKIRSSSIKGSYIHKSSKVESGSNLINVRMEKHSFCGYDCETSNCDIGSYTSISNSVVIGGGEHPIDWVSMSPAFYKGRDSIKMKFSEFERKPKKKTIIGHDVWIGRNALIKAGVNIGNGAVVGMGSIVTKDVLPYTIVAGNPAKVIKMRFDKKTIEKLQQSQWWIFSDKDLRKYSKFIKDPEVFLENILL